MSIGPSCPAGDACENRIFLQEYEKVDREHERYLVGQCAMLRAQVNRLESELAKARDPEEVRDDGARVRKDRWERCVRNISNALGWRGHQEVDDVLAVVRKLIEDQRASQSECVSK